MAIHRLCQVELRNLTYKGKSTKAMHQWNGAGLFPALDPQPAGGFFGEVGDACLDEGALGQ